MTTLTAFAAAWAVVVWLGDSWLQLIVARVLGVLFTQLAFLGHDGGHQQIWRSRRANDLLGIFAGVLLVGLSFGWWVDKHNRHHAHPNHEGHDPDIGDGGARLHHRPDRHASPREAIIGANGGAGWAPIGKIRRTVAEVAEMLGEDFGDLVYKP